ncbi:hypothetical protein BCD70_001826 [Clostridium beijerinckii]|nr:hypothetical protein [Clostridium beijerinckii]
MNLNNLLRTDLEGTVIAISDGININNIQC